MDDNKDPLVYVGANGLPTVGVAVVEKVMEFDKLEVFKASILPLAQQIAAVCVAEGINYSMLFETRGDMEGRVSSQVLAATPRQDQVSQMLEVLFWMLANPNDVFKVHKVINAIITMTEEQARVLMLQGAQH